MHFIKYLKELVKTWVNGSMMRAAEGRVAMGKPEKRASSGLGVTRRGGTASRPDRPVRSPTRNGCIVIDTD